MNQEAIECANYGTEKLPVDLVIFTEKVFNGKLHFLCSNYRAKCICLRYFIWSEYMERTKESANFSPTF